EDRWIYLEKEQNTRCVFVEGIEETLYFPIAHAEGKFIPADEDVLAKLERNGQVVFRYVDEHGARASYPWNPNGSVGDIAGICDSTGRVFGLMPHPERHVLPTQHPRWTREGLRKQGAGRVIFENAVRLMKEG
ncbi:MAG: phosphoribosylformylglycinamidine synthase subunit PurQ, partial [Candidatus Latescibacteria bacterium]|nr:phosphoribosylformylglycinamidine synthase subunit PurQ [Candidatus Latescibacterota bacterium]